MADSEKQQGSPSTNTPAYDAEKKLNGDVNRKTSVVSRVGEIVNASGHRDQLQRHYSLLSICGLALTIDNAWVALGGSIAVSIGKTRNSEAIHASLTPSQQMADRPASFTNS